MLKSLSRQLKTLITGDLLESPDEVVKLPDNQREFKAAIFDAISKMNPTIGNVIEEQVAVASIIDCYGSKVGCFTDYTIPDSVALLPDDIPNPINGPTILLYGLKGDAKIPEKSKEWGSAGVILFHESGKINFLECYSNGTNWPTDKYEYEFMTEASS